MMNHLRTIDDDAWEKSLTGWLQAGFLNPVNNGPEKRDRPHKETAV
jgi:hypothetical protein